MDHLQPEFLQTDAEDFERINPAGPCRPLPVFRAGRARPDRLPALLLFEGPVSGSGEVADWREARSIAAESRLILAGGLRPDNVADAMRAVRPYGLDVSSGVESAPGVKCPSLIRRFVEAVRETERNMDSIGEAS
jgi:phosphoribosylanthranilate isomerase